MVERGNSQESRACSDLYLRKSCSLRVSFTDRRVGACCVLRGRGLLRNKLPVIEDLCDR